MMASLPDIVVVAVFFFFSFKKMSNAAAARDCCILAVGPERSRGAAEDDARPGEREPLVPDGHFPKEALRELVRYDDIRSFFF